MKMAKIIGLDCGHGLRTSGKQTPDGVKEWTLNDKVRDKIVALLSGYDVKFIFTDNDEGNTDEALATRVRHYINAGVDAFVSIHHNAFIGSWNNATGVEVYVDKNPTAKDNALANAIYNRLPSYTGLKGRGIKKENWYVINQNKIPAVLVEGGFMDSRIDNPVITSNKGQEAYAKAVAEGLIEFLGLTKINKKPIKPAPNNIETLAREVIAGKYGNGDARKQALGSLYGEVQARVNEIVLGKAVAAPKLKSVDEVARAVIRGDYGNGTERRRKLEAEGYDYRTIQNRVNELV